MKTSVKTMTLIKRALFACDPFAIGQVVFLPF